MLRRLLSNPHFVLVTFGFVPGMMVASGVWMAYVLREPWQSFGFAIAALGVFITGTVMTVFTER